MIRRWDHARTHTRNKQKARVGPVGPIDQTVLGVHYLLWRKIATMSLDLTIESCSGVLDAAEMAYSDNGNEFLCKELGLTKGMTVSSARAVSIPEFSSVSRQ